MSIVQTEGENESKCDPERDGEGAGGAAAKRQA